MKIITDKLTSTRAKNSLQEMAIVLHKGHVVLFNDREHLLPQSRQRQRQDDGEETTKDLLGHGKVGDWQIPLLDGA